MTSRADYTEQEWTRLKRAPLVVAMAISLADPGGPFEVLKESGAALQTTLEAAEKGGYGPLADAVAREVAEQARRRENPLGGFRPDAGDPRAAVLDELRGVEMILRHKADEEEADGYRELLRVAAQRSALAAREGGFLGFGGQQVSDREQAMLGELGEIFGTPAD